MGFPCGSAGKESACNVGDLGSILELGRSPGEGNSYPFPVLWPGEFPGQRSLAGYSPWGRKESGMTKQLPLSNSLHKCILCYVWALGLAAADDRAEIPLDRLEQ